MNPSEFPEVKSYTAIFKILQTQVDMLFNDIRTMLKQPLSESDGGCNFAAANFICDIISGISVILYKPDEGLGDDRSEELMQNYYPWDKEDITSAKGYKIIHSTRNAITHRLGLKKIPGSKEIPVGIKKSQLTVSEINELENLFEPRPWYGRKTIEVEADGSYSIIVMGFYRGLLEMLKKLFEDKNQMQKTDKFWGNIIK